MNALRSLWQQAGLAEEALVYAELTGADPVLPSSFAVGTAAQATIVHVSLSAYGNCGPWAGRRGFDSLVQTAMGFNAAEADAAGQDAPRPLPMQILDEASGFGELRSVRHSARLERTPVTWTWPSMPPGNSLPQW